jgi:four helix bundle protein
MQDYTRLLVWQRARGLMVAIRDAADALPPNAAPGLRSQLMRAVMSIGSNIAEGATRESRPDFARFISIAIASASEAEHHLNVCCDLGLLGAEGTALMSRCAEVRRMLFGLRRAVIAREVEVRTGKGSQGVREPLHDDEWSDDEAVSDSHLLH